jgi:ferredoxin
MLIVPVFLFGHIVMWEESRFGWSWVSLPDSWADKMTLILIGICLWYFFRHLALREEEWRDSLKGCLLILIVCMPFVTGYLLSHEWIVPISSVRDKMDLIHVVSGEVFLLVMSVLFCVSEIDPRTCTGCLSCVPACPVKAISSRDEKRTRVVAYSSHRCVLCGGCVVDCPEDALELKHEIGFAALFQVGPKEKIQVELAKCRECGRTIAPLRQVHGVQATLREGGVDDVGLEICEICKRRMHASKLSSL